jgi:hypothetical protein
MVFAESDSIWDFLSKQPAAMRYETHGSRVDVLSENQLLPFEQFQVLLLVSPGLTHAVFQVVR